MTLLEALSQQQAANQQQTMGNMQTADIFQRMQQAHAARQAVASSGGDVEVAMQKALQVGDVAAAHQLAPLVKLAQEKKLMQGVDFGKMTPDQLDILGQKLAAGGHPGAATVMTIADRRRKAADETKALDLMRSKTPGAVDPQELSQAADGVSAPPAQAGFFTDLMKSNVPEIAAHAGMLQKQLDSGVGNSAYFQRGRDALAARETALLNRPSADRPVAVVGADNKPVYVPASEAIGKRPYSPSQAGAGEFTPEALRMTAEQYLTGDRQAVTGYARNSSARIALQNEIVKVAKEKGWKGSDIAAQMADFQGIMSGSRTVGVRAAQIELASSEAEKMIDIVLDKSKGFSRTSFVPLNEALKAYQSGTGQSEVKEFGAAINSLVNVYARAISPSGVPTVSDKEHAREILKQADSPEQVQGVMNVMRQEMQAARAAPGIVRDATRRVVTGAPGQETPTPATGWSIRPRGG